MIDWSSHLWPDFQEHEFACRCGCGRADMDPYFMLWLQQVRNLFDAPMIVTSGFRCPEHNADVSSTGLDGPHTTGKAVDIAVAGVSARRLYRIADKAGVLGLGVHQKGKGRFLHLDKAREQPAFWTY